MSRGDFLQEYVEEVREHLQELESSLLVLEREGSDKEEISNIFRAAHSIKGASSYMGFEGLAHLTHELESLISEIQVHSRPVTAKGVNLLLECVDFIARATGNLETYREELPLPPSLLNDLYDALSTKIESAIAQPGASDEPRERDSSAIVPESEAMEGPGREEEQVGAVRISSSEQAEVQEDELARIRVFLSSFREQFWELVNALMLLPEMVLAESDFERVLGLIEELIGLSRQEDFEQLVELLQEWQGVINESRQDGRNEREYYSSLLNTYGKRLQEDLPSLELPFLAFGSEEAASEAGDAMQEEEDKELLSIFVDTFQRNFAGLLSLTPPSPETALSEADLERACDMIKRMVSSARYMDYDQVIDLLRALEISLVGATLSRRSDARFYSDLLSTYGRHLQDVLPILQLSVVLSEEKREEQGGMFLDEEDEELLSIFLDSFQQNLAEFASLAPRFPQSPLADTDYEHAREVLGRLISSASYMDYGQVVDVLKDFDTGLRESILSGRIDGQLYSDIFNDYGVRLRALLPSLRIPTLGYLSEETAEEEKEDEELLSIFVDSFEQNFSQLLSLSPPLPESMLSEAYLEQARELIKRSIASARYMDYGQIVDALQEWDSSLLESWKSGEVNGRLYSELLNIYGEQLRELVPALQLGSSVFIPEDASLAMEEEADEGEDKELVSIFLASFQQSLSELALLAPPLSETVLSYVDLERAWELLERSASSAHYMDYEQIVSVLKEWEESLKTACASGKATGRMYSGMLKTYARPLEQMLLELKNRFVPSFGSDDQTEPAVSAGCCSSELAIDILEDSPLLSTDLLVEDLLLESGAVTDEMVALSAESRLQGTAPSPEKQTETGERTPLAAGKGGAVVTLRVDIEKVDQLLNQVMELAVRRSEFVDTAASFKGMLREFTSLGKLSKEDLRKLRSIGSRLNESTLSLGRVATNLQDSVMRVRMLPLSQLFMRFPRVIRDQALKLGKKAELVVEGEATEIDKRVLEQMYDPMVQFLRNAMVHGIELPVERRQAKKPEQGMIRLSAYQEGDYVVLNIEDDGRGIDTEKLRRILKQHKEMRSYDVDGLSNEELIQAIFLPGVSTHGFVDGTAGRGVGLDVVKENVERMNGTIEVESEPGIGTRFTVRIPLTVAIIRALLVKGVNQVFALPLNAISQILRYGHEDVHTIEGFQVIYQRGKTIPLLHLSQLLGVRDEHQEGDHRFIVVVATTFREVGIVVDGLLGEREIVIKPIEDELHTFEGFSGATILGDGTVSLILDVSGLLRIMKDRRGMPGKSDSSCMH